MTKTSLLIKIIVYFTGMIAFLQRDVFRKSCTFEESQCNMRSHVKIRHNVLWWLSKPLDQSPNHVIMIVSCTSTSLLMSDHSSDCGEMSFEGGARIDKNGNISVKLCGFVCITRMARTSISQMPQREAQCS